jgi:hypothetical protein
MGRRYGAACPWRVMQKRIARGGGLSLKKGSNRSSKRGRKSRRSCGRGERACFGFAFGGSAKEAVIAFTASIGSNRKPGNERFKKSPGFGATDMTAAARRTISSHLEPSWGGNGKESRKDVPARAPRFLEESHLGCSPSTTTIGQNLFLSYTANAVEAGEIFP